MTNLSLEKLTPKEAELITMANSYKNLTIKGIDDRDGYLAVSAARKQLAKTRVQISKDGKLLREEAIKFQRDVIKKEKELIAIIEPVELELEAKEKKIDDEKMRIAREVLLPDRRAKLAPFNLDISDAALCLLDAKQFDEFYNIEHGKYLAEQAEKLERERKEIEAKKLEVERMQEVEAAKIKAAETAKQAAEEKAKADAAQALIDAENRMKKALADAEAKRLADIKALKDAEEKKANEIIAAQKKAIEEQQKIESKAKFQKFLDKNNYHAGDDTFFIKYEGNKVILYKKLDTITL